MQTIFRKKEVTVLDQTIMIGELSVDQVDDLVLGDAPIQQGGETKAEMVGSRHAVREKMAPVVAASLRNAEEGNANWYVKGQKDWPSTASNSEGSGVHEAWSPALAAQAGFGIITGLYTLICEFTGLRTSATAEGKEEPPSKGEGRAAARLM